MVSGNIMSGKSSLCRLLNNHEKVVLLNETYSSPNRYLPLFIHHMQTFGVTYNEYAYGTQLLFMQNRVSREKLANDPSKHYIIDRSIYEDRHIFAKLFVDLGIIAREEYDDYKNMFEKIIRSIDPPECFVFLDSDPDKCFERLKTQAKKEDSWLNHDLMVKLDILYKQRLPNRIRLHNPQVKMIQVNTDSYPNLDLANEAVREQLEAIYGELFVR